MKMDFLVKEESLGKATDPLRSFLGARVRHHFPEAELLVEAREEAPLVMLSLRRPLFDEQLTREMWDTARRTGQTYRSVDAIAGTDPLLVGALNGSPQPFFSDMQRRYCTNMDVSRPNRRLIFDRLLGKFPDLHEWPLKELLDFLESDPGLNFVVSYGEPVELETYETCPSCEWPQPQPLFASTSHPITGFLTKNRSIYSYCPQCGLAFLNRQMPGDELWRYYGENSYANPADETEIEQIFGFLSEANTSHFANYVAVQGYVQAVPAEGRIGDLGAGRGEFAVLARQWAAQAHIEAIDWRFEQVVKAALTRRNIVAVAGDIQASVKERRGYFDLLCSWEVLEHLKIEDLDSFLEAVQAALRPGGMFIFSTPDFMNPYTHALDFWAMAPGEHISILSRRFLEPKLQRHGFEIVREMHESVTLKQADSWFSFGEATDVSFASKASSGIINDFLSDSVARESLRARARENGLGSELILVCQRS